MKKNRNLFILIGILLVVFFLTNLMIRFYNPVSSENEESSYSLQEDISIKTLIGQAYCAFSEGNYPLAEKYLYLLLEKETDNRIALQMLSKLYLETKNYERAELVFENLYQLNKKDAVLLNNLAQIQIHLFKYSKAIKNLKKAVELTPDSLLFNLNLATAYLKKGDKKDAIIQLEKVCKLAKQNGLLFVDFSGFDSLKNEAEYQKIMKNLGI